MTREATREVSSDMGISCIMSTACGLHLVRRIVKWFRKWIRANGKVCELRPIRWKFRTINRINENTKYKFMKLQHLFRISSTCKYYAPETQEKE